MAGDHDQEEGEEAPVPRSAPPFGEPAPDALDEKPEVDENAIIREGIEARRQLGQQVAQETLADPGGLTPDRLRRLGPEGLERFVAELRHAGLGSAQSPSQDGSHTASLPEGPLPRARQDSSSAGQTTIKPCGAVPGPSAKKRKGARTRQVGRGDGGSTKPPHAPDPPGAIDATSSSKGWWRMSPTEKLTFEEAAGLEGLLIGLVALGVSLFCLAITRL